MTTHASVLSLSLQHRGWDPKRQQLVFLYTIKKKVTLLSKLKPCLSESILSLRCRFIGQRVLAETIQQGVTLASALGFLHSDLKANRRDFTYFDMMFSYVYNPRNSAQTPACVAAGVERTRHKMETKTWIKCHRSSLYQVSSLLKVNLNSLTIHLSSLSWVTAGGARSGDGPLIEPMLSSDFKVITVPSMSPAKWALWRRVLADVCALVYADIAHLIQSSCSSHRGVNVSHVAVTLQSDALRQRVSSRGMKLNI